MKLSVEFWVGRGDVMDVYGLTTYRCGTVDNSAGRLEQVIKQMAVNLGFNVRNAVAQGTLHVEAHLVTHPEDRPV